MSYSKHNNSLIIFGSNDNPYLRSLGLCYQKSCNNFSNSQISSIKRAINLAYKAGQYQERKYYENSTKSRKYNNLINDDDDEYQCIYLKYILIKI